MVDKKSWNQKWTKTLISPYSNMPWIDNSLPVSYINISWLINWIFKYYMLCIFQYSTIFSHLSLFLFNVDYLITPILLHIYFYLLYSCISCNRSRPARPGTLLKLWRILWGIPFWLRMLERTGLQSHFWKKRWINKRIGSRQSYT